MTLHIPFNKPYMTGKELWYISQAHHNSQLSGDGPFTREVHQKLKELTGSAKVLLTHSCTAALEMAAILADIQAGDEVILPSFTFVSTANAFALRGANLVFAEIRPDTLNIDETRIEGLVTEKTKAIVPVHYAGVGCEMDTILGIAQKNDILVIEDAAQGIGAFYKDKMLGSMGHLGAYSFHETKNITSGEGGALLINDLKFAERAEIIREKGTNRSKFFRGQVDKYSWVDIGSSYLPGEIIAAFLKAQLEEINTINDRRIRIWERYHQGFKEAEEKGYFRRPIIPANIQHNAHMYYILAENEEIRDQLIVHLKKNGIIAVFHYLPLHKSEFAKKMGYDKYHLPITDDVSSRLLRLPLFADLTMEMVDRVMEVVYGFFSTTKE